MAGVAGALRGHQLVGIDTSVFIYHIEDVPRYSSCTRAIFERMASGSLQAVTSVLTLMELAVKPLRAGKPEVADEYEVILANYPHLTIVGIDRPVARAAADLRATYRLRPADAIQVATCLHHGATAFLTNDRDLRRVAEISVLILEEFV